MAERVIVRQDKDFKTIFLAADPEDHKSLHFETIENIHQLTPYGMLLCSLASCTAIVLHTYAQNHDIPLQEVEMNMEYQRVFRDDCEDCDENKEFSEEISEKILLKGDLSGIQREKLLRIAHFCPIYKMVEEGVRIKTSLIEGKMEDD